MPEFDEVYSTNSSTWWEENGRFKLIHAVDKFIVPYYLDVISKRFPNTPPKNIQFLDVGCGGGLLAERFAAEGYVVTGIDINSELIDIAKTHANQNTSLTNLSYSVESVEEHAVKNAEKYNIVVINFVLQHITHHELFLKQCAKCLKPGGIIFITNIGKNTGAWLMRRFYIEKMLNVIPVGLYEYDLCINASDVGVLLKKNKCETQEVRGFFYNFLTGKCFWFPSSSGYYVLYAVKNK